jgi:hypothetical protein
MEVGFKLQVALTAGDEDDWEDDCARTMLSFFLSSRVFWQVLECKLYEIYMNTNLVSQKKAPKKAIG